VHIPIGKLHTERLVPADADIRQIVARILALRALAPPAYSEHSEGLLLPRPGSHDALYQSLRPALAGAAQRAGCSGPVTAHRLRHYAEFRTMPSKLAGTLVFASSNRQDSA